MREDSDEEAAFAQAPSPKRLRLAHPSPTPVAAPGLLAAAPRWLGQRQLINEEEYVRLLQASLSSLGFEDTAAALEAASGVRSQSQEITQLQAAVTAGEWATALTLLGALGIADDRTMRRATFMLLEGKFTEALSAGDIPAAVRCLRHELSPLDVCLPRLQHLTAQLVLQPPPPAAAVPSAVARHIHRLSVLQELVALAGPGVLVPEHRLEALVETALLHQINSCAYHNQSLAGARPCLLLDHRCGTEHIPSCCHDVLLDHQDEVWAAAFSHNGAFLATAAKDRTAILWQVEAMGSVTRVCHLKGHGAAVAFLAWSSDDELLATASQDTTVSVWEVPTGRRLHVLTHHTAPVTCLAWVPGSKQLLTGGHDTLVYMVDLGGHPSHRHVWRCRQRVQDIVVPHCGAYFLVCTVDRRVRCFPRSPESRALVGAATLLPASEGMLLMEGEAIVSMSLSQDGRRLLANLGDGSLKLWDLGPGHIPHRPPVQRAHFAPPDGQLLQSRFVVRSCLGGERERFVLSGSEDGSVLVYLAATGELIHTCKRHAGTVNAVSWNPKRLDMFASVSDDCRVNIYRPQPRPQF